MEFSFMPCRVSSIVPLSTTNLWEDNSLSNLDLIQDLWRIFSNDSLLNHLGSEYDPLPNEQNANSLYYDL